jgi:ABC-2 type transport system permease protein
LTFAHLVRSEWIKLFSLRSTLWAIILGAGAGLVTIPFYATAVNPDMADGPGVPTLFLAEPAAQLVATLTHIAVIVIGTLAVTADYTSGAILSQVAAVPRRGRNLAAKAVVLSVAVFAMSAVATYGGMALAGLPGIQTGYDLAWTGEAGRILVGGCLYLVVTGLFCLGVGAALRSSAGGMVTSYVGLMVLPGLVSMVPFEWAARLTAYLPSVAGSQVFVAEPDPVTGGAWGGLAIYVAWAALVCALGAWRAIRRDA